MKHAVVNPVAPPDKTAVSRAVMVENEPRSNAMWSSRTVTRLVREKSPSRTVVGISTGGLLRISSVLTEVTPVISTMLLDTCTVPIERIGSTKEDKERKLLALNCSPMTIPKLTCTSPLNTMSDAEANVKPGSNRRNPKESVRLMVLRGDTSPTSLATT